MSLLQREHLNCDELDGRNKKNVLPVLNEFRRQMEEIKAKDAVEYGNLESVLRRELNIGYARSV